MNLNLRMLQRAECQRLEQEAVKPKLTWSPQDVKNARATGCLPKKADNRKWNQPRRKKFLAINKDEKAFEEMKTTLASDMMIQSLEYAQLFSCLALGIKVK